MNSRAYNLLLALTAPLLLAGCLQGTIHERKKSFAHYKDTKIGQESTKDFLEARSAFLLRGEQLGITMAATNRGGSTNDCNFTFHTAGKRITYGSATAIDRRGYFLTAAHSLGAEPPWLLFDPGSQWQAERASVVWRGDLAKGEPDLAVLCVPHALAPVFSWAPDFKAGDRVFAVGANRRHRFDFSMVCLGGVIAGSSASPGTNSPLTSISHTAPLHKGDSGGPLVDAEGRLLGINVRAGRWFSLLHPIGKRQCSAMRPEPAWLSRVMDEHSAAQATAANLKPNER